MNQNRVRVGDYVLYHGKKVRVVSTSGIDSTCRIAYDSGKTTGWIPMDDVTPVKSEPVATEETE